MCGEPCGREIVEAAASASALHWCQGTGQHGKCEAVARCVDHEAGSRGPVEQCCVGEAAVAAVVSHTEQVVEVVRREERRWEAVECVRREGWTWEAVGCARREEWRRIVVVCVWWEAESVSCQDWESTHSALKAAAAGLVHRH